MHILYDPLIPLLGIPFNAMKTCVQTKTYTQMNIEALFTVAHNLRHNAHQQTVMYPSNG